MEADLAEAREVHLAFNTVKAKMQLKSAEADHMLITCAMVDGLYIRFGGWSSIHEQIIYIYP